VTIDSVTSIQLAFLKFSKIRGFKKIIINKIRTYATVSLGDRLGLGGSNPGLLGSP